MRAEEPARSIEAGDQPLAMERNASLVHPGAWMGLVMLREKRRAQRPHVCEPVHRRSADYRNPETGRERGCRELRVQRGNGGGCSGAMGDKNVLNLTVVMAVQVSDTLKTTDYTL